MLCCGGGGGGGSDKSDDTKFNVMAGRWDVEREAIGEGGFGTVHLCKSLKTGKQRACKAMRLPTALDREDFRHEVLIMKKVKHHRNICHIVDSGEDARYGYLIMQSCTGGELFDRIAARNCKERDAAMAVVDVLSALKFIHAKRIIHRDLKPENLLYKDKGPGAPLKLIDFGLALQLQPGERATEVCGTTSYMAPEVLHGNYSVECDNWSLGIITYFMLSGSLPFPGRNDDEKEDKILRVEQTGVPMNGRAWEKVSANAKDFIKKILLSNPRKRLSNKDALNHPWLKQIASLSDEPLGAEVANSLKKYANAHRFEKAIRHQMATHLTKEELHRLRNVFEKLDTEGTGQIAVEELLRVMKEDAADAKTAETLSLLDLTSFDLDGDGQIDWQEFVAGAMHDHEVYNEDNLEKVFASLDTDGNGTLCQREVAAILGNDHEFSREVLANVQRKRGGGSTANEVAMTLEEFKALMLEESKPAEATGASTRARRRHHDPPVGAARYTDEENKI